MKFSAGIHGVQMTNLNDFGNPAITAAMGLAETPLMINWVFI